MVRGEEKGGREEGKDSKMGFSRPGV